MTVQPHASRPSSHLTGCAGFWLWALVGAGLVFGAISFVVFFFIPPIVLAVLLTRRTRRTRWTDGPALFGIVAGAGLPLLIVAALNWGDWHHRTIGDGAPNPLYWGAVGVCLLVAGSAAYEVRRRGNT